MLDSNVNMQTDYLGGCINVEQWSGAVAAPRGYVDNSPTVSGITKFQCRLNYYAADSSLPIEI